MEFEVPSTFALGNDFISVLGFRNSKTGRKTEGRQEGKREMIEELKAVLPGEVFSTVMSEVSGVALTPFSGVSVESYLVENCEVMRNRALKNWII